VTISPDVWDMIGRYGGAGLALGLGGIGAAMGMGAAAAQANEAIMRQPARQGYLLRTMLIGQAVGGSPSIFALVVGLLILFLPAPSEESGILYASVLLGSGLSIGLGCFGSGLGCGWPAGAACDGVARNPDKTTVVTSSMIVGQAVAQSPSIFATMVALILLFVPPSAGGIAGIGIAISAGLAMGIGALGPGLGSGVAARGAVQGLSNWPRSQAMVLRTMLIGQAVCQTPAIFGMLVAFIMLFTLGDLEVSVVGFAKVIAAGISVGIGGFGPALGCGMISDTSCVATATRPDHDALMLRTMLIGQAVSQSTAIYALIISLVILYVV